MAAGACVPSDLVERGTVEALAGPRGSNERVAWGLSHVGPQGEDPAPAVDRGDRHPRTEGPAFPRRLRRVHTERKIRCGWTGRRGSDRGRRAGLLTAHHVRGPAGDWPRRDGSHRARGLTMGRFSTGASLNGAY